MATGGICFGVLHGEFRVWWSMVELLVRCWLLVVQLHFKSDAVVCATLMIACEVE